MKDQPNIKRPEKHAYGTKLPLGDLYHFSSQNLEKVFNMFNLTENEKRVLVSASGVAKTTIALARHTKIPRSTVQGILNKLEKRSLVTNKNRSKEDGKIPRWKSNIRESIKELYKLHKTAHRHSPQFNHTL